jgi:hypothetical protein
MVLLEGYDDVNEKFLERFVDSFYCGISFALYMFDAVQYLT